MEEKTPSNLSSDIDDDIIGKIKGAQIHIFFVGASGKGDNTISRLNKMDIKGAKTIV